MKHRINNPSLIIIHCSATADSRETLSWGVIRRNHLARGWDDIGYHAGAEFVRGQVECLVGRPEVFVGAHCYGHNHDSLGFCFVGDFDRTPPTNEVMHAAARRVLVPWLRRYELGVEALRPHRDFTTGKTCPGLAFDMQHLRNICKEIKG